jgi:NTP pyrophosphatase (non-canonical NTP hydrolase)
MNKKTTGKLNFLEYQDQAMRTKAEYKNVEDQIECAIVGIAGEAGELLEHMKKYKWQGHKLNFDTLIKECGDVLWYISLLANALELLGISNMNEIAKLNIEKLKQRYPNRFDPKLSINRIAD